MKLRKWWYVLLPLIQDIEICKDNNNELQKEVKSNSQRKLNFYDYIYLMSGNELLKFKIELGHMDVVNVLEQYIDLQRTFDYVVMSEKAAK